MKKLKSYGTVLVLAAAGNLAVSKAMAQSYTVSAPIGLITPSSAYLSTDNGLSSNFLGGSLDGYLVGTSVRYGGGNYSTGVNFGTDTWSYNATTQSTTQAGLTAPYGTVDSFGVGYQTSTGKQTSNITTSGYAGGAADVGSTSRSPEPYGASIDGAVIGGTTNRYLKTGDTAEGTDAWAYNGLTGQTTLIGPTDAATATATGSTATDGYRSASISWTAPDGYVIGYSSQYLGASHTSLGSQPWVYNPNTQTTTLLAGLATGGDGQGYYYQSPQTSTSDKPTYVDASGNVTGVTQVFTTSSGGSSLGTDAWYYNGSNQSFSKIGFYGTTNGNNYTATSGTAGTRSTSLSFMTNSGFAAGVSEFFAGGSSSNAAYSAWAYNPATNSTANIGLSGAAYVSTTGTGTGTAGLSYSTVSTGNDNGYFVGISHLYTGLTTSSFNVAPGDAYLYHVGGTSQAINPMTAMYVDNNGNRQTASTMYLFKNGNVAGTSTRFNGTASSLGTDAWFYNGSTASIISLTGAGTGISFTSSANVDGATLSVDNSAAGFIAGYNTRYQTGTTTTKGQDAWMYNANTGTTYDIGAISLSSDGYTASSTINYINNLGWALGTYTKYSGSTNLGTFPFIWSPLTDTATDLDSLITNASGWTNPVPFAVTNVGGSDWIGSNGSVLVYGIDSPYATQGKVYAVASVSVPEPTSLAAVALIALGTLRRRRRTLMHQ